MTKQYVAVIVEGEFDPSLVTEKLWNDTMAAHGAFAAAVEAAGGRVISTGGLDAAHAVSIHPGQDGGPAVFTDGPFAEAKEVNHGFYLLELPDDADVHALAAMIPSGGHVDLYPVMTEADYPDPAGG
ncbi:YciI family protein [Arthrobacter sp. 35W]|uniref:YciI family protein n=1 Tax=Arthrobacter sp. 35W TaxID=1132441 RepID=UPI0003F6DF44|nr:YciI family protein [Arthrobacter sp. 35W]